jgi:hypothetical protein
MGEPSAPRATVASTNYVQSIDASKELAGELNEMKRDANKDLELSLYGMAKERFRLLADALNEDMIRLEVVMFEAPSEEVRAEADALWSERRQLQKQTFDMLKLLALR